MPLPDAGSADPHGASGRVTVIVLTHRRPAELRRSLAHLVALPERPPIVVVDNASRDGTAGMVRREFPQVTLVELRENLGAAGRNAGVERAHTPFIAFCDDDAWWAPGALGRAVDVLQAHPSLGALAARVLVGDGNRPDPACEQMAASPLPRGGAAGPALIGFMAGAVVMRTAAFRQAGGYERRFGIGAEEMLLAIDLVSAGWRIAYVREVALHHHPSSTPDARARRVVLLRNRLWLPWLRLSPALAWHRTRQVLRDARAQRLLVPALLQALRSLPWVLSRRRVAPAEVQAQFAAAHGGPSPRLPARWATRSESVR